MQLGEWEVKACMAGHFGLDGGAMFGVVPRTLWEKRLPPDDANRIPMVMRLLIARGSDRTVLVDVGAGTGYAEKLAQIYAFENVPPLAEAVADAGVDPGEITDVLLTHLHFDHGAGVVEPNGDDWKLVFPKATHHVQQSQWGHAFKPNPRDRASYLHSRLQVMEREGVLQLHDGPWLLSAGFELLVFDGHSPGQQLPKISGGGETVFFCGDLVPTHHHIPTPYIMAYDLNPVLAMEEKVPILEKAHSDNWVLFFEHDAHMEACRLSSDGKQFSPQPVSL